MDNSQEKRKYNRMHVDCEVHFALADENGQKKHAYMSSIARDLSAQGMSFDSMEKFNLGDRFVLKMKFGSKPPVLKLLGEVRRCTPAPEVNGKHFKIGVIFLESPEKLGPIFMDLLRHQFSTGKPR